MAVILFLLECDAWMCSRCHAKIVERFMPFDIPIHQAVHCEWKPEHGWAVCVGCGFFQGELPEGESAHPLPSTEQQYALLSPQAKAIYDFYRDIGDWQSVAVIEDDFWLLEIPEDMPDHIANIKNQFGVDVTIPTQTTEPKEEKVEKKKLTPMQEILKRAEKCRESIVAPNVPCHTCNGSGVFVLGPIENGRPRGVNKCYCCAGKGYQTPADVKRDNAYHNHQGGQLIGADIRQAEQKEEVKNMETLVAVFTDRRAENGLIHSILIAKIQEKWVRLPGRFAYEFKAAGRMPEDAKYIWIMRLDADSKGQPIVLLHRDGDEFKPWTKSPLPVIVTVGS